MKKTLLSYKSIQITIIILLLLFVFSCKESSTSSDANSFILDYTKCKVQVSILAELHTDNHNDGTKSDRTQLFALESEYATGVIDKKERVFEGTYDILGDTGTIKVVFVNENLIESISWMGTTITANNTQTATIIAKNIYIDTHDVNTYVLDKDDGVSYCQNIPTVTFNSEGHNIEVSLTSYTCDENGYLWIKFQ